MTPPLCTPDGRYIIVRGRLWRAANPHLSDDERAALTRALMDARRAVRDALRTNNADAERLARQQVHAAKVALGERGPVWWTDGAADLNRTLVKNTPYAAWYAAHESEAYIMAPDTQDPTERGPKPPMPAQQQTPPGSEAEMQPKPDYGKESYQGSGKLKGKVAIVTGGDSGIGRAVALAFAREGADVAISYLNEEQDAQTIAADIEAAGQRALCIPGDIGEPHHCQAIVDRTIEQFGRVDILVNNAAYQKNYEAITDMTAEELQHTYRTNIFAMFYLCKAAMPHMKPGATIINTASIQAYQPSASLLAYATTKGAIVTFTKGFATEAIEKGIRVNCVAPGPVWTPLIPSTLPTEQVKNFGKETPIGRVAQPAELAPAFVFLASPESSYIVGEVIGVTGGKPLG